MGGAFWTIAAIFYWKKEAKGFTLGGRVPFLWVYPEVQCLPH